MKTQFKKWVTPLYDMLQDPDESMNVTWNDITYMIVQFSTIFFKEGPGGFDKDLTNLLVNINSCKKYDLTTGGE